MKLLSVSDAKSILQGNLRVLAIRGVLLTVSGGLAGGLDALYIKEILGADAVILGLFASIWSAVFLIFVLIGGWISDRYDRRKMFLLGTALTLPNPLIYALAPTWHILILANFLGALGSAIMNPAYVAMLVTSVDQQKRTRAIAAVNTLTSMANVVVPPLGASIVIWMGGLKQLWIIFLLQFVLALGVWLYVSKGLRTAPTEIERETKGMRRVVKDIFHQMREVYQLSKERKATPWLYLYLTGPFAWEVVGPFWTIYAAEVCGSSLFVIGLLTAILSFVDILLEVPMASIADSKGRKKVMLAVRPFQYLCLGSLILGGTYKDPIVAPLIPILAWTFRGIGNIAGPSWTAASTEVIPEEAQGKWNALQNFLWRITAIPASLIGGFLWNIDPRLPFIMALMVDGLIRYPILIHKVPETLVVHYPHPREVGRHVVIYGLPEAGLTSVARLVQKSTRAEIIDETSVGEKSEEKGVSIPLPLPFTDRDKKTMEKKIEEILAQKEKTAIIEGKPAVFAAGEPSKSTVILLVAPREERARRKAVKSKEPEFVALKEVEEKDREITKLTRKLYGADISKLPPFDVAINTERVSPEKVAKIIAIIRGEEKEGS
ncbi:MAG: MFS transporter [Candidatus Bathyarchaeia archaeon]